MDGHFRSADFKENIPVILALITVWYNNFWGVETEAIIPYSEYLRSLPAYLQQGIMESNGKGVDRNGKPIDYQTGNIIWGASGTNAQHAFFQLMHQGTKLIPADFIGFAKPLHEGNDHHDKLMSNFFAQTQALMMGKSAQRVTDELKSQGKSDAEIEKLLPFKVFEGNRPSNTLFIDQLNPFNIGALIAIYEHRIFVQGVIWNIFSYDQWGVELGKQLANNILSDFDRVKDIELNIVRKITQQDYVIAVFGVLGMFMAFYFTVFMISCCLCIKEWHMGSLDEESRPIISSIEVQGVGKDLDYVI